MKEDKNKWQHESEVFIFLWAVSVRLQQIKTIERYMRRLEFHISKVSADILSQDFVNLWVFWVAPWKASIKCFLVSMPSFNLSLSSETTILLLIFLILSLAFCIPALLIY